MDDRALSMAQTIPDEIKTRDRDEAVAELERLRAEIAAGNPDMTDEDWDRLAERAAAEINEALREHVRRSRAEFGAQ